MAISTRGASAWVRKTPTGLPDCTSSVSSSLERLQRGDDAVEARPSRARPGRCRHRRRARRASRRPRGRGCSSACAAALRSASSWRVELGRRAAARMSRVLSMRGLVMQCPLRVMAAVSAWRRRSRFRGCASAWRGSARRKRRHKAPASCRRRPAQRARACSRGMASSICSAWTPLCGLAVMARDPAALEAAIDDMAQPVAGHDAASTSLSAGSQLAPSLVPRLNTGSVPSNRRGITERIEWQS